MLPLAWRARQFHPTGPVSGRPDSVGPAPKPSSPGRLVSRAGGRVRHPVQRIIASALPSFHVEHSDTEVEAWSLFSLPFELKEADHMKFCKTLQYGIDHLAMPELPCARHGLYGCPRMETDKDAENQLFYNVRRWKTVSTKLPVLRFEHIHAFPRDCPVLLQRAPLYYYRYSLPPADQGFAYASRHGPRLLEFSVRFDSADGLSDRAPVWLACCRALLDTSPGSIAGDIRDELLPGVPFGMAVTLLVPDAARNYKLKMKGVFDGVLSALHWYGGSRPDIVAGRLSDKLGVPAKEVEKLLLCKQRKPLGGREFVRPWRTGVQFSPQDDRCIAGELRIEVDSSNAAAVLKAKIFPVRE